MAEWFDEWFDSQYYHILYKSRDSKEAEVFISNLAKHLKLESNSKVLDLACGKGRHAVYLNKLGFEVLGLDLSENSISQACEFSNERLKFLAHDMRESFPKKSFDVVFNLFTSFGYFNDSKQDLKTLNNIKDALKPKGYFVFDFLNIQYIENNLVSNEEKLVDGIYFNLKRYFKRGSLYKNIKFNIGSQEYEYTERVDSLKYHHLLEYFKVVGMEVKGIFGDYDLNSFDINTSKRLIFITQKL